jgi:hypothetical protein
MSDRRVARRSRARRRSGLEGEVELRGFSNADPY